MLTQSPAWQALQAHHATLKAQHLRALFARDPARARRYCLSACGLTLDYSKNLIDDKTLGLLMQLAEQQSLSEKTVAMFNGGKINRSEARAALHTALRSPRRELWVDGENIMSAIHTVQDKMTRFVESVRSGQHTGYSGKKIHTVVNIGIGGSDLGPKMVTTALCSPGDEQSIRVKFISNVDKAHFRRASASLDHETTLFVITSKTFTTRETMLNAQAARHWFLECSGGQGDISKHFVAVSTAVQRVQAFGIDSDKTFAFWDWVGGRYSLWSAVGLSIALALGMDTFRQLLAGGHAMDQHFYTAPWRQNMPVLLALIGIWYNNFYAAEQYLILPYSYPLKEFPAYIQQLDMESNGKHCDIDGQVVDYATGPVVWGGLAAMHSTHFPSYCTRGTHWLPTDFIVSLDSLDNDHGIALAANYIGQTQALMHGKTEREVAAEVGDNGHSALYTHRALPGNRPSNAIVLQSLDAYTLGALIALYEHKVFVQGVIWRINSFDQWGVELGKQRAKILEPVLNGQGGIEGLDASTQSLSALFSRDNYTP